MNTKELIIMICMDEIDINLRETEYDEITGTNRFLEPTNIEIDGDKIIGATEIDVREDGEILIYTETGNYAFNMGEIESFEVA